MATPRPWTVLPHDPIVELDENLWTVEGSLPNMAIKRRMTVARDGSGGLWIHSAAALDETSMKKLEAWGTPRVLIVPNGFHRMDAHAFKQRYPALRVFAPRQSRKKVAELVSVDGDYGDLPAEPTLTMEPLRGVKIGEGALFVKGPSGTTAVFNDVLFNMEHLPGFMGFMLKHVTQSTGGPRVSRLMKVAGVGNKPELAAHLREIAGREGLVRVVPGHGAVITAAPDALRAAADTV